MTLGSFPVMCMHACMHACMYVCMYVCMHVCMHAYMLQSQFQISNCVGQMLILCFVRIQRKIIVPMAMKLLKDIASARLGSLRPGQESIMQAGTLSQVLKKGTITRLSQQLHIISSSDDDTPIKAKLPTMENISAVPYVVGLQVSSNRLSALSYFT